MQPRVLTSSTSFRFPWQSFYKSNCPPVCYMRYVFIYCQTETSLLQFIWGKLRMGYDGGLVMYILRVMFFNTASEFDFAHFRKFENCSVLFLPHRYVSNCYMSANDNGGKPGFWQIYSPHHPSNTVSIPTKFQCGLWRNTGTNGDKRRRYVSSLTCLTLSISMATISYSTNNAATEFMVLS